MLLSHLAGGQHAPRCFWATLPGGCLLAVGVVVKLQARFCRQLECVLFLCGAEVDALLVDMGREIARMHDGGLVHGDLTTSNMLVRQPDKQVVGAGAVECK